MIRFCAASTRTIRSRGIRAYVAARCRSTTGHAFWANFGVRCDGSSARIEWGGGGPEIFGNGQSASADAAFEHCAFELCRPRHLPPGEKDFPPLETGPNPA